MYLLVTNIYNEREKIAPMFERVSKFTVKPMMWLWIVDGSTDGSEEEIERCAGFYRIPVNYYILPPKEEGSLRTIGKAYNMAFDGLDIRHGEYDFMVIMDVDAKFPHDYTLICSITFSSDKTIGVISGIPRGIKKLKMPTGNGKAVRWNIVQEIDKFWNAAPDTFLNIKAKSMGYRWHILDFTIDAPPPSRIDSYSGALHAGWLWYYVSGSWSGAIARMVYRMFKRRFGIAFIKGFLDGRRDKIQAEDVDVKEYYGRV